MVAVSVWAFVALLQAARATQEQASRIQAEVATLLQVSPVGSPPGE